MRIRVLPILRWILVVIGLLALDCAIGFGVLYYSCAQAGKEYAARSAALMTPPMVQGGLEIERTIPAGPSGTLIPIDWTADPPVLLVAVATVPNARLWRCDIAAGTWTQITDVRPAGRLLQAPVLSSDGALVAWVDRPAGLSEEHIVPAYVFDSTTGKTSMEPLAIGNREWSSDATLGFIDGTQLIFHLATRGTDIAVHRSDGTVLLPEIVTHDHRDEAAEAIWARCHWPVNNLEERAPDALLTGLSYRREFPSGNAAIFGIPPSYRWTAEDRVTGRQLGSIQHCWPDWQVLDFRKDGQYVVESNLAGDQVFVTSTKEQQKPVASIDLAGSPLMKGIFWAMFLPDGQSVAALDRSGSMLILRPTQALDPMAAPAPVL